MKRMRASMKAAVAAGVLAALGLIAIALFGAGFVWTEYQWYQDLGRESVFVTRLLSQGWLWLIATALSSATIFLSARTAAGRREQPPGFGPAAAALSVTLGAVISWNLASHWMAFRLAIAQSPFGIADPQFGRDVGFFVFTLPALELANTWANGVLTISIIAALAVALLPKAGTATRSVTDRWREVKPLFSVLFGLLVLSGTFGVWLSIWQLDLTSSSQFTGAGYSDIHAVLPSLFVMIGFGLLTSMVMIVGARSSNWKPLAAVLGTWMIASFAIGSAWPTLMQNYVVAPNEAALEAPYIERNIAMTRLAFGLSKTHSAPFSALEALSGVAASRAASSLGHARVWTPSSVEQAYKQLQTIRPYYRLSKIDTDRYVVNGKPSQVLVAAREIDPNALPARAQTWVNQHLVYTHGYGLAISSASDTTERGFPQFLVGSVPPAVASEVAAGSPDLEIDEPRIYFGPDVADYALINTGIDELDYPSGESNVYYHNDTDAGVRVGTGVSQLMWAARLGTDQVLFSDYVTKDSRLLLYRDVRERARRLAPWLAYDENPYPAIVDGRIVWILDGFTSSDHFPYSQPLADGTNYLRDSVKVTVDAASGETHLYASGDDPVRDAWSTIFPGLIEPTSAVPDALAAHFRVPQKLFSAQSSVYRTYHMTDSRVFYNREDQWEYSGQSSDSRVKPNYLMLKQPGDAQAGMYMVQPYAPQGSDNLIGWMAASCEPGDLGEQTIYLLPKDRVTLGPQQVKARIEQDPTISPTLSLWDQRGSKVVFGDMLVLPVEDSIAYVQPVFLQAEKTAVTELAAVIVVSGDHVEMGSTLSEAIALTFGTAEEDADGGRAEVERLFTAAQAAKARGDDAGYDTALRELSAAIEAANAEEGAQAQ